METLATVGLADRCDLQELRTTYVQMGQRKELDDQPCKLNPNTNASSTENRFQEPDSRNPVSRGGQTTVVGTGEENAQENVTSVDNYLYQVRNGKEGANLRRPDVAIYHHWASIKTRQHIHTPAAYPWTQVETIRVQGNR